MSGGGISTDGLGNIFAGAGNETFVANTGGGDYGDSASRLVLTSSGLTLANYFTPGGQSSLNNSDMIWGPAHLLYFLLRPGLIHTCSSQSTKVEKSIYSTVTF